MKKTEIIVSDRCDKWDCGWCYHEDKEETSSPCVGFDQCELIGDKKDEQRSNRRD